MLFYKLLMISKIALAATLPSTASWPANRAVDAHEIHRVEKRATPSGDEILNALGRHIADARSAAPGSYGASHIKGLETLKAEEYYQWWDCMDEMFDERFGHIALGFRRINQLRRVSPKLWQEWGETCFDRVKGTKDMTSDKGADLATEDRPADPSISDDPTTEDGTSPDHFHSAMEAGAKALGTALMVGSGLVGAGWGATGGIRRPDNLVGA